MDTQEKRVSLPENEQEQENDLIFKFKKPYVFDRKEYTEVDLSDLENTTAADLSAVNKILNKTGTMSPVPEMSMDFAIHMAARVAHLPVEFFQRMPSREAIRLKNIVTGFLYGGDGDN